jgi:hypothetical protein
MLSFSMLRGVTIVASSNQFGMRYKHIRIEFYILYLSLLLLLLLFVSVFLVMFDKTNKQIIKRFESGSLLKIFVTSNLLCSIVKKTAKAKGYVLL